MTPLNIGLCMFDDRVESTSDRTVKSGISLDVPASDISVSMLIDHQPCDEAVKSQQSVDVGSQANRSAASINKSSSQVAEETSGVVNGS